MSRSRWHAAVVALVLAVGVLAVAGCSSGATTGTGSGSTTGSGGITITESGLAFNPTSVSVKVGDVVTFTNKDNAPHNVVVGPTDLGIQQPGQSVSWTADANSIVEVRCLIHPMMAAAITVGGGGPAVPAAVPTNAPAPSTGGGGAYGY